MEVYMMDFGTRLKTLRKQNGLTQQQLASIIGCITPKTISAYERNENITNIIAIHKICQFFGTPIEYLISGIPISKMYEISNEEIQFVYKYRSLSDYYKSMIDYLINSGETV